MKTSEIRTKFLEFFASKAHKIIESDSLVPKNDPSVLFTSAGMNQFKEQFMGNITDFRRAASCQKCLRTADLINVGVSPTHHTFFEMLGNFSFGDYFKTEAISWAWEFVTEVLGLEKERLWISVHREDDESFQIWSKKIKVSVEKIIKLGDKDNFWPANAPKDGPNGPCGPCSEIFYDRGKKFGCQKSECNPACDCGRFTEIWNLVFTQFNRQSDGTLVDLPSKNIDTGMGLERLASVMQNVRENYQTDLFVPIIDTLKSQLKRQSIAIPQDWLNTKAKAVVDHMRAATFAISDGVIPSNETRGYVIRKLIRRSIVNLKQVGVEKPFCYLLVYNIAKTMQAAYPELMRRHETISGIIKKEEEMFWSILNERTQQVETAFKELSSELRNKNIVDKKTVMQNLAEAAFFQYDTFGIPLEMSKEIAQKYGLPGNFDEEFEKAMNVQRERSRNKTQMSGEIFAKTSAQQLQGIKSEFIGYEYLSSKSKVQAILKERALVDEADENEQVSIALKKTPFYAESGGQVADKGILFNEDHSFEADVLDTVKIAEAILHVAKIKKGKLRVNDLIHAQVYEDERIATARNHTATHLLQYALRKILGEHVEQSGSYVCAQKLRFDFSHFSPLKKETIRDIEQVVNRCIWDNQPVGAQVMNITEAKNSGALAFFGEKYSDQVRVLSIGDYSQELCGGTHVKATGQIGIFKIIAESSVAQGIRRIEAITASEALTLIFSNEKLIEDLSALFKIPSDKLLDFSQKLIKQSKIQEKELEKIKINSLVQEVKSSIKNARKISGVSVIIKEFKNYDMNVLRKITDMVRAKVDPVVCVLASLQEEKSLLVVALSSSLSKKGVDAVKIIKQITSFDRSLGGGKKELAQAGTKDTKGLQLALKQTTKILEQFLKG